MRSAIAVILPLLLWTEPTLSGPTSPAPEYKDYQQTSTKQALFKLKFSKRNIGFSREKDGIVEEFIYTRSDVRAADSRVNAGDQVVFDNGSFIIGKVWFNCDQITDLTVSEDGDYTVMTFYTRTDGEERVGRVRRGNVVQPTSKIVIEDSAFVRGLVLSVTGDIEVRGEINKDVVSLFGNVTVGPQAVIRGDVVSVTGEVKVARGASVYGEIHSTRDKHYERGYRFRRRLHDVTFDGLADYNRVDGLTLGMSVRYEETDSLLPILWAEASYAFASTRWRYNLGLEQTLLRRPALVFGLQAYRRLASDDDWLLSNQENMFFTLLVTEDFKDYYEAEGGRAYVKVKPSENLQFTGGYMYEVTEWLDAHRHLWSLFGGHKLFAENFASVPLFARTAGENEIDTSANGALFAIAEFSNRDEESPYDFQGWKADLMFEWSQPSFESDFDYTRIRLSAIRYQPLIRQLTLAIQGIVGASDGRLPMHKQFYLGGLGTLHGYRHKEYSGERFWLANIEYRVSFPRSDLAAALFWDMGQISAGNDFGGVELKNSAGVSVYMGSDFKVMLARRLDSGDENPVFYARLVHAF